MRDKLIRKAEIEADELRKEFNLKACYMLCDEDDEKFVNIVADALYAKEKRIADAEKRTSFLYKYMQGYEDCIFKSDNSGLLKQIKELETKLSAERELMDRLVDCLPWGLTDKDNPATEITVKTKSGGSGTMGPNMVAKLVEALQLYEERRGNV